MRRSQKNMLFRRRNRRSGVTPELWTPADLPADQELFWYLNSYEDNDVFTANGTPEPTITDVSGTDRATAWDDLSGNEYNGTSGGSNAPIFTTINGKVVPYWNTGTQYMPCVYDRAAVKYHYAVALLWVYENPSGDSQGIFGASSGSTRMNLNNSAADYSAFTKVAAATLSAESELATGVLNGGLGYPVLVSGWNNADTSLSVSIIYNGNEYIGTSGASAANETIKFFNGSSAWRVGTAITNSLFDAAILSLFACESDTSPVDSDTRDRTEGYLAHKAGVASALPAAHPYKSAAPTLGYEQLDNGLFVPDWHREPIRVAA